MFLSIADDQIIPAIPAMESTTTDDSPRPVHAATGHVDGETRQSTSAWRRAMSTVMVATSIGASSTPGRAGEPVLIVNVAEQASDSRSSIAGALSEIADRYESVLFSYPARVLNIEHNVSGDPISVTLLVSVEGNDNVIKRPIRQFRFEVRPDMRLIADGVQRGGAKQLAFRVAQPLQLDEEQDELLNSIVTAFKTGTDV